MLSWNTIGRPALPQTGLMGWNRTTNALEVWNGAAWVAVGGGGGGGTPDVATISLGWQDFLPDLDPAWSSMGPPNPAFDGFGNQYGWDLPAGADTAIVAFVPLPSNIDVTRNPLVQVHLDDAQGQGTNVNFWTLELGFEDAVCGGPFLSGVRGTFPGMNPMNLTDTNSVIQCPQFVGSSPYPGASGVAALSIRRRGTADTAPRSVHIMGLTLELPSSA